VAITSLGELTLSSNGNKTAAASIAVTTTATPAVGDLVVVQCGRDDVANDTVPDTLTDTHGNTWNKISATRLATVGTALDGVVAVLFWSKITTAFSGTTTLTWSWTNNATAKSIRAFRYSGVDTIDGTPGTNNAASTAVSASVTPSAAGALVIGFAAREGAAGASASNDTDTTNGTWSATSRSSLTTGGTAATNCSTLYAQKIVTASGAQTFNSTIGTSTDWAAIAVAFSAAATVSHPITASGSTTTDGSAAINAQRPWDLSGAVYDSKSLSVSSQDTTTTGLALSSDGSKLYIVGDATDSVYQYTLSTPWDVSSGSYASKSFSFTTQETIPRCVQFSADGSTMYTVGTNADTVYQYTLSTAWDVSTASYASKSVSVSQDTSPRGIAFSTDGFTMYMVGNTNKLVFQYTLSTAWDVSTASYASKSFDVATQEGQPQGLAFKSDGSTMFAVGSISDTVHQYTLSTPWDVSTASYASKSFDVATQDGTPQGLAFRGDGSTMYVAGSATNAVYQYALSPTGGATSHPVTADGSTTTDGSATVNATRPVTASGSTTTDGSAAIEIAATAEEHPVAASGSTDTTGAANIVTTRPVAASGATVTDGSATVNVTRPVAASGSTDTTGSASINILGGAEDHPITATGATTTTGAASVNVTRPVAASGATSTDGTATVNTTRPLSATGATSTDGAAGIELVPPGAVTLELTTSGSTTTGGTAAITVAQPVAASGSTSTDGAAGIDATRPVTATGATTTGGTGNIRCRRPVTATGATATTGAALIGAIYTVTATGAVTTDGAADIAIVGEPTSGRCRITATAPTVTIISSDVDTVRLSATAPTVTIVANHPEWTGALTDDDGNPLFDDDDTPLYAYTGVVAAGLAVTAPTLTLTATEN